MAITILARFRVPPANVTRFSAFAQEVVAMVREKEAGRTVTYAFHATGPDGESALAHEVYADGEAFVAHLGNLGDRGREALGIFDVEEMAIIGALSSELVDQLKAIGGAEVAYYGTLIAQL